MVQRIWRFSVCVRCGALCIACLGLLGLQRNLTGLPQVAKSSATFAQPNSGTPAPKVDAERPIPPGTATVDQQNVAEDGEYGEDEDEDNEPEEQEHAPEKIPSSQVVSRDDSAARSPASALVSTLEVTAGPPSKLSQGNCKGDSFYTLNNVPYYRKHPENGNGKRVALLLRGDAFRTKASPPADSTKRLRNQANASRSHVEYLLKDLSAAGYKTDIYMHSYLIDDWQKTEGLPMLQKTYEPWGRVFSEFHDEKPKSQGDGVVDAVLFLKKHMQVKESSKLPYEYVILCRFDVVFTSTALPPNNPKFDRSKILFPMRDCNTCWKQMGYVHDTVIWVPRRYFKDFLDDIVGSYGCYQRSKHWFAGSGHGCWPNLRRTTARLGFWNEGCFRVRDPHPLYYLIEARQEGVVKKKKKRKRKTTTPNPSNSEG